MKRTPITRRTPLSRQPLKRRPKGKARSVVASDRVAMAEYREQHNACACCRFHWPMAGGHIELHHILNGKWGRPDFVWNVIPLCFQWNALRCHELAEGNGKIPNETGYWPTLSLANVLWLKREMDDGTFDLPTMQAWVSKMGRRILPELERPAEVFFEQRAINSR